MPSLAHMSAASSGGTANMVQPVKDEHVHLFLFYYASKGSIFHPLHDDGPLVQVQMLSKANPSPIYKVQTMISLYGNQQATKGGKSDAMEELDARIPVDLQEVEHVYGARVAFVGKKTTDEDDVGLKKNRAGWYVSLARLQDFLMYWDDIMSFRKQFSNDEFDPVDPEFKIIVHAPEEFVTQISLQPDKDELSCGWSLRSYENSSKDWAVEIFELPAPVFPPRVVVLTFELIAVDKGHAFFGGNTKPFQDGFVCEKIKLRTAQSGGKAYPEYYRVLEHMSFNEEQKCVERLSKIFAEVLHDSPVVIKINNQFEEIGQDNKVEVKHHDPSRLIGLVNQLTLLRNVRYDP